MKQLKIDEAIGFTDNISEADVLFALQSKLRKNSRLQAAARSRGIPIYVTKVTPRDHLPSVLTSEATVSGGEN